MDHGVYMQWFNNLLSTFSDEKTDISAIREKLYSTEMVEKISDADLKAYVKDIKKRIKKMVKELQCIYEKYGIEFSGFKTLDSAGEYLMQSIEDNNEAAYNNLIKLESVVTAEQRRHLGLIRMAMTADGKKVIDQINSIPADKQKFISIFGEHDASSSVNNDGMYQHIWSEIHKLSEYILINKNRVYH